MLKQRHSCNSRKDLQFIISSQISCQLKISFMGRLVYISFMLTLALVVFGIISLCYCPQVDMCVSFTKDWDKLYGLSPILTVFEWTKACDCLHAILNLMCDMCSVNLSNGDSTGGFAVNIGYWTFLPALIVHLSKTNKLVLTTATIVNMDNRRRRKRKIHS